MDEGHDHESQERAPDLKQLARSLPLCKKGCERDRVVVIPVNDTTRNGYVIQCSCCQAGTPIQELTEAVKTWTQEFSTQSIQS